MVKYIYIYIYNHLVFNSLGVLPKIKHTVTIRSRISTSGYVLKRSEGRDLNRYLYSHVHSSVIHNKQKVE